MKQERERMGADLPNRGQSHNVGFGATKADLNRGFLNVEQPSMHEDPQPFRRRPAGSTNLDAPGDRQGFVNRSGYNTERT